MIMKIHRYLLGIFLCLIILSCGGSGKNKKREPSRRSKRNIEVVEERKENIESNDSDTDKESRNNGNYRKPKQSRRSKARPVERPEEETIRDRTPNEDKIEKRVELEEKLWKANNDGNSAQYEQLREDISNLVKKMSQKEIDEAARRIKDLKKRQYY